MIVSVFVLIALHMSLGTSSSSLKGFQRSKSLRKKGLGVRYVDNAQKSNRQPQQILHTLALFHRYVYLACFFFPFFAFSALFLLCSLYLFLAFPSFPSRKFECLTLYYNIYRSYISLQKIKRNSLVT